MIHGRSEPAGLCELRNQFTEAKVGPLKLRRKQEALYSYLALVIITALRRGTCAVNGIKCCACVPPNLFSVHTITIHF